MKAIKIGTWQPYRSMDKNDFQLDLDGSLGNSTKGFYRKCKEIFFLRKFHESFPRRAKSQMTQTLIGPDKVYDSYSSRTKNKLT
ncbi:MAG: hypothetical protein AB2705_13735 [Candidatus Thiodiazotropha sp.]